VKPLTFSLRERPSQRLDLSPLVPHLLAGKSAAEIERIALQTTRQPIDVGEIFRLDPGDPSQIRFEGGCDRFDHVGQGMTGGEISVEGDVGIQAGRLMSGGRLTLRGNAGPWAASGMKGGVIEILGTAGGHLGGPLAGETTGMRGGIAVVRGAAGDRTGDRMRRGTIVIEGDSGAYSGSRMIAGTLIVAGKTGPLPGFLMKRGTILLGEGANVISPTFVDCGEHALLGPRIWAGFVEPYSTTAASLLKLRLRRLAGDMAVLGNGEIFLRNRN
jgi:formylmethanofuran dehydrogenase subunit C